MIRHFLRILFASLFVALIILFVLNKFEVPATAIIAKISFIFYFARSFNVAGTFTKNVTFNEAIIYHNSYLKRINVSYHIYHSKSGRKRGHAT
jgi:hypothetical protein